MRKIFLIGVIFTVAFTSCKKETEELETKPKVELTNYKKGFITTLHKSLLFSPISTTDNADFLWKIDNNIVANTKDYSFNSDRIGVFKFTFIALNSGGVDSLNFIVSVNPKVEIGDKTPYISDVLEFKPAPGQFINGFDSYDEALESIVGNPEKGGMISLGSFGGYVTFKFDHRIVNGEGDDLGIYGNAFKDNSEPGSVMVSRDLNGNGKHDEGEPWYELAGSEYFKSTTKHNYSITYFRPKEGVNKYAISYVESYMGVDSKGVLDLTPIKTFHKNNMFPNWLDDSYTLSGSIIESNSIKVGSYWKSPAYDWGYVDNKGYLGATDNFDISWAVDTDGKKVDLPSIDFVKVYNCTLQVAQWLGERSTEVTGAVDLSLLK